MSILATLNSVGNGWTLEKVLKVDVKFARLRTIMVHHTSRCSQKLPTAEDCSTLGTMKTEIASGIALWRLITCIIK